MFAVCHKSSIFSSQYCSALASSGLVCQITVIRISSQEISNYQRFSWKRWTNTFCNLDKYILQFRQIHFKFVQINFKFGQIHLKIGQIHLGIWSNNGHRDGDIQFPKLLSESRWRGGSCAKKSHQVNLLH